MPHPDYVIAGAGIIGLSLALELNRRGASVVVLDAGAALRQTSFAAAGMLAVDDPANPPALHAMVRWSASIYPEFLDQLAKLGAPPIPFQTTSTLQATSRAESQRGERLPIPQLAADAPRFHRLDERSLDPRQLGEAIRIAVAATSIELREHSPMTRLAASATSANVEVNGSTLDCATFIDCMGSWSPAPVAPRKGQMLAVKMPGDFDLRSVVRTDDIYIVPRTVGPDAGRALIGATMEDVGFDLTVHRLDILTLHARAVKLLPDLAHAEYLESWAGLRPATVDGLPLLGFAPGQPRYLVANGHFRNGILLAPATARALAQLLAGETPEIDLSPFSPTRFSSPSR